MKPFYKLIFSPIDLSSKIFLLKTFQKYQVDYVIRRIFSNGSKSSSKQLNIYFFYIYYFIHKNKIPVVNYQ